MNYVGIIVGRKMNKYDPNIHHRRSIRLKNYDYSQVGMYFVTICTQNSDCFFGNIVSREMQLNDAGMMVQSMWEELPSRFANLELDAFVVMPNHIHGIFALGHAGDCTGHSAGHSGGSGGSGSNRSSGTLAGTVGRMVQAFKSITTHQYIYGVRQSGWAPFPGKLWQRNYWEHVIRNDSELNRIREYIQNNPAQWEYDKLYVHIQE